MIRRTRGCTGPSLFLYCTMKRIANLLIVITALAALGCGEIKPERAATAPLPHMFPSLESLVAAVVQAVADSNEQLLRDFVMTEAEYRDVVWANLDSMETKQVPMEMTWGWNVRDTETSISRYLGSYGGRELQLTRIAPAREVRERNQINVHRGVLIYVAQDGASEEAWKMLNVILEYQGWFKVITYHD